MSDSRAVKTILFIAGLVAIIFGASILFTPISFYAGYGIELTGNLSLLNETRAPGGALLASGILIVSGAFINRMTFTSMIIATCLFLSYGFSRIISIVIDGIPSNGLMQATAIELVIGFICAFVLARHLRENPRTTSCF